MKLLRAPREVKGGPGGQPGGGSSRSDRVRRVLALVGDSQVGLWVVRSLGRAGLSAFSVCASPRGLAARSRFSSGAWRLESSPESPGFADEVLGLARELDCGSVMTIAEEFHQALIAARGRFEPDIHLFSPPAEAFARASDKDAMHALCEKLGVPVARGARLDQVAGDPARAGLRFPMVLRTRRINSTTPAPWKAAYVATDEELRALYEPVRSIADNIIVQEYHGGVEDHVQILMHRGEAFMEGDYIGEHHMPLAGGVTVRRVSCRHEPLVADAVKLLKAIGWDGVAGVQFHYEPKTDQYIFLEINPRFIGGLPTVIRAGFDAPYLLWQSHFEPEGMVRPAYRLGLRTRILGGDANWLLGMWRRDPLPPDQKHVGKLAAAASFLWHSGPWTRDDTFWLRDPLPWLTDFRQMAGRLREKSVDLVGRPDGAGADAK
jgi:predicted ATP-grasp superfamily ATP-dependent carboligase